MIKEHVRDLIERKIEHRFPLKRIEIVFRYPIYMTEQNILPRVSEGIPKENLLKLFVVGLSDGIGSEWSG